ncbi:MAG: bifunctional phosphoribosyl-AMP cyclohydrolase/phosphoribosyl-ATP diphosphatase HisIE [Lachnospiraceae bacterium]|nr:bifunctional phosphoribosyl-AMP cyclohydrolase/phosphoribosyl-ATP diphosphatase HisIE [Lachnospiraceae bacterium]
MKKSESLELLFTPERELHMMNSNTTKAFYPCIYIAGEYAVRSFTDLTVIEALPHQLALNYEKYPISGIIVAEVPIESVIAIKSVTDTQSATAMQSVIRTQSATATQSAIKKQSATSAQSATTAQPNTNNLQDSFITVLRKICQTSTLPILGYRDVKKMEDVKKILYAGATKAILGDNSILTDELLEELGGKFGKEQIIVSCTEPSPILSHSIALQQNCSALFLKHPHGVAQFIDTLDPTIELPICVHSNSLTLNKWMELLTLRNVCAVAGNLVSDNLNELDSFRQICRENGIPVNTLLSELRFEDLKMDEKGLVPVVVQEDVTKDVLMVAYMNQEAFDQTLFSGKMTYYSRSRSSLWEKGETSGHFQIVKELRTDCDRDTILATVTQVGPACHTGAKSCFFEEVVHRTSNAPKNPLSVLTDVYALICDRKEHPKEGSYTNYLFDKGIDKILKKVGEEATEIVIAAKNPDADEIKYEISDFLYHMMVLMAHKGVSWEEILAELANR